MGDMDLDELKRLRQARDPMDREYAEPLDVAALARPAGKHVRIEQARSAPR